MKKSLFTIALVTVLIFLSVTPASAADQGANIFIDGTPLGLRAVSVKDVSFVPFRVLFEKLGMGVGFNSKLKQVTGTKKDLKLTFTLGSKTVFVNGKKMDLQSAPFAKNGTTYIPVRIVGEVTGNKVLWTKDANLIQINSPSFKGASYRVDDKLLTIDPDGTITVDSGTMTYTNMTRQLAEEESIRNFVTSHPLSSNKADKDPAVEPDVADPVITGDSSAIDEEEWLKGTDDAFKRMALEEIEAGQITGEWIDERDLIKKTGISRTFSPNKDGGFHMKMKGKYDPEIQDTPILFEYDQPNDWQDKPDHETINANGLHIKSVDGYDQYLVEDLYVLNIVPRSFNDDVEEAAWAEYDFITSPGSSY